MARTKQRKTSGTASATGNWLSGVGALVGATDRVRRLVTRWYAKGKTISDDTRVFVAGIYRTGQRTLGKRLSSIGNAAGDRMEKVLHTFRLASVGDVQALGTRVDELNRKLKKMEKKSPNR